MRVSLGKHGFKYPGDQICVDDARHVIPFILEADVVVFMHSSYLALTEYYKGRRLFVFHGGTAYRQNSQKMNQFFDSFVEGALIQTFDLWGLGAQNRSWVIPPVNLELIQPAYSAPKDRLVIGHFPSSKFKGTDLILKWAETLQKDRYEFRCDPQILPWAENLSRMKECDIILEACSPEQGGAQYGFWGMQALEAAAMGKIVASHFFGREDYEKSFGPCPIFPTTDIGELDKFRKLLDTISHEDLLAYQPTFRKWVERFHSYEAVGRRLAHVLRV